MLLSSRHSNDPSSSPTRTYGSTRRRPSLGPVDQQALIFLLLLLLPLLLLLLLLAGAGLGFPHAPVPAARGRALERFPTSRRRRPSCRSGGGGSLACGRLLLERMSQRRSWRASLPHRSLLGRGTRSRYYGATRCRRGGAWMGVKAGGAEMVMIREGEGVRSACTCTTRGVVQL